MEKCRQSFPPLPLNKLAYPVGCQKEWGNRPLYVLTGYSICGIHQLPYVVIERNPPPHVHTALA